MDALQTHFVCGGDLPPFLGGVIPGDVEALKLAITNTVANGQGVVVSPCCPLPTLLAKILL